MRRLFCVTLGDDGFPTLELAALPLRAPFSVAGIGVLLCWYKINNSFCIQMENFQFLKKKTKSIKTDDFY